MNKKLIWGIVMTAVVIFLGYQFVYKPVVAWRTPALPEQRSQNCSQATCAPDSIKTDNNPVASPTPATTVNNTNEIITVSVPKNPHYWWHQYPNVASTQTIEWTRNFGNAAAPVSVDLIVVETGVTYRLLDSVSSDGKISVNVGGNIPDGRIQIRICDIQRKICGTSSPFPFLSGAIN